MVKYMPVEDPQRAKLLEAAQIAQKIAKCEIDDLTRRAAVMHCLGRTIDGFPVCVIFQQATASIDTIVAWSY